MLHMIRLARSGAGRRRNNVGPALGALAVAAVLVGGTSAYAQVADVMIPAAPGGGWDRTGRATMQAMQQEGLVPAVQFTNKGGGGGTIGLTDFVRNSKGKDNALMFMGVIMMGSALTSKSPITVEMTTPIARLTHEYLGIGVPANSPFKTMADFTAALKQDPGALAVGISGMGTVEHLALAQVARHVDVPLKSLNPVVFSGNEFVPALIGGNIKAMITGSGELKPLADAGRVRILAVTSQERLQGLDVPTLKEAGLNVVVGNWRGVVGAPGMSEAAKKTWLEKFDAVGKSKAFAEAIQKQGLENAYLSGDGFAAFIAAENKLWRETLKDLGLLD